MQEINLRELYPDVYKTDTFLEVTDEVQEVFLADERAEAVYERKMYRYKAQYSLDCENGIENAILHKNKHLQDLPLAAPYRCFGNDKKALNYGY